MRKKGLDKSFYKRFWQKRVGLAATVGLLFVFPLAIGVLGCGGSQLKKTKTLSEAAIKTVPLSEAAIKTVPIQSHFQKFTGPSGLDGCETFSVTSDKWQNIFVGTTMGLYVSNDHGKSFVWAEDTKTIIFQLVKKVVPQEEGNVVWVWAETPSLQGTLWRGTYNSNHTNTVNYKKIFFSSGEFVTSLVAGRDGSVFVGTTNGLYKSGKETKYQLEKFTFKASPRYKHLPVGVESVYVDDKNHVWFSGSQALYESNDTEPTVGLNVFSEVDLKQSGDPFNTSLIYQDENHHFWISTIVNNDKKQPTLWTSPSGQTGSWTGLRTSSSEQKANFVINSVTETPNNKVWFGTKQGGLFVAKPKVYNEITRVPGLGFGDADGYVSTVCNVHYKQRPKHLNALWVGTLASQNILNVYVDDDGAQKGDTLRLGKENNDTILLVWQDKTSGVVLIGTDSGLWRTTNLPLPW